jgi:AmmeMemoRadiSam system protein B
MTGGGASTGRRVRPPAVAGTFYPADPVVLGAEVDALLTDAGKPTVAGMPKALVAPHAGYRYSGPIAASAYATLRGASEHVTRVILLGPAHYVPVRGLAASSSDAFATPLGEVPLDRDARMIACAIDSVDVDDAAHAPEHSLEVQLPFLQRVLGDFSIVPFVIGRASPDAIADVLDGLWGGPETIIVVSSDLSHYHDYATATALDRRTADAIVAGRGDELTTDAACGAYPVRGLLTAARQRGLAPALLDLRNSGDTAGPNDRVVGYGSFALAAA